MAREVYRHPELGEAVAWLRDRSRLTQRALAEAVDVSLRERWRARPSGERRPPSEPESFFSRIYVQKIEGGERAPATDKLDALLEVLGSNREELEGLLAARPWATAPPRERMRSRARAKPADFIRAAEDALAAGPWSSPIMTMQAPADRDTYRAIAGELAELRDHYLNLPREQQEALLEDARRRRYRR